VREAEGVHVLGDADRVGMVNRRASWIREVEKRVGCMPGLGSLSPLWGEG